MLGPQADNSWTVQSIRVVSHCRYWDQEGALDALAVLCATQEDARGQVLEMQTLPFVVAALKDERPSVCPIALAFLVLYTMHWGLTVFLSQVSCDGWLNR